MTGKSLLDKLVDGDEPAVTYGDLCVLLKGVKNCDSLPLELEDGPYRTWRYEGAKYLTVRDNGARPMYPRYVRKAARFLRRIRQLGGI